MPGYAYRWADGSISVCSANDIEEAMTLFDQFAPVSKKLIIELDAPLLFTMKPKSDMGWRFDTSEQHIGEDLDYELLNKCYPNLCGVIDAYFEKLEKNYEHFKDEYRKQLRKALRRDKKEAQKRLDSTKPMPDFVAMFPKGFRGQQN